MNEKDWLGKDNQLAIDIWNKKYKYENENFEEWLGRISNGNDEIAQLIREQKFLFAGRILANRGLQNYGKKVTYSNCYVLAINDDSIEAIYQTCADLARTFSYGGGVGIDISPLRAKGMKVNNAAKTTTGAVSFMNTFSNVSEVIGQNGRRGATMLSIDCHHPDLEEFINVKNDLNAVTKANISVRITDDFMNAVINDLPWKLSFETKDGDKLEKEVSAKELFRILAKNNWDMAEPGILFWDRIENYNIISEDKEFKYAGVNPCAEEPLPNGGSCLLGSFNLAAYVKNKEFMYQEFLKDIDIAVKAMNEVLDEGLPLHPLEIQRRTVHDYRQIGIGVMGIADMLIKLGMKYDSEEAIKFCDDLGFHMANQAIKASAILAMQHGYYPKYKEEILNSEFIKNNTTPETYELVRKHGLRNSQILTIAPTGTLSTMLGISGGIEPIFSFSYTRKTQSLHGEDVYYKVYTPIAKQYMKEHNLTQEDQLPDIFVSSQTIDPFKRIDMQSVWQKHIDASISSTVNLPNSATIEEVEQLYISAWKKGLKGMTIFRDGCARAGVLITEPPKKEEEEKKNRTERAKSQLNFGDTILVDDSVIGIKRKLKTGCGSLHCTFYFCPETGELREVFLDKGSSGGCLSLLNACSRLSSLAARKGAPVEEIADQLQSVLVCPSYSVAKAKAKDISKGSSCASAVANALLDAHKQFVEEFLEIDEDEEIEIKTVQKESKKTNSDPYMKCPECGERSMIKTEGCVTCHNCGYSKCG